MIVSWILFPLVLAALCLGCGLLVRALTGAAISGLLLIPLGFAVAVVIGEFASISDLTAELATPLTAGFAVAGFLLAGAGAFARIDRWAVGAVAAAFLIYAAPVAFSGEPTIAGFIKLDDTATWLALTDRVVDHGNDVSGLAPSSYEATLDFNLADGYPIGAFLPLGIGATFVGTDIAWLIQPYMAFIAVSLVLCLYALGEGLVASRPLRVLCAVPAGAAALLFGYYLWGGIKEVGVIALLALGAALLPVALEGWRDWRLAVPLAVTAAAVIGMLTVGGGGVWIAPMLAIGFVVLLVTEGLARAVRGAGAFAAALAALTVPWLLGSPLLPPTSSPLDAANASGNLGGSLNPFQVFGIWPVGDFRVDPDDPVITALLIAVVAACIGVAVVRVWRDRSPHPAIVFSVAVVIGGAILYLAGSPWVDGKALATASAAVLFAGLVGAAILVERGLRIEGGIALAAIVLGVLWSDVLAYRDVWLAPRDKLAELERIGEMIDDDGPALMTEYEPYGVRHFLREADPEGASELRRSDVPLVGGGTLAKAEFRDIDALDLAGLLPYRTLVLRRSPYASRPPLPFQLTDRDRFYEVWQRPEGARVPRRHLGLSEAEIPTAIVPCEDVRTLASTPGVNRLAYSERVGLPVRVPLATLDVPAGWIGEGADPDVIEPSGDGTATGSVETGGGEVEFWLGGSVRGRVEISVDGEEVGFRENSLDRANHYTPIGTATLSPGPHEIEIAYEEGGFAPGSGEPPFPLGPLLISPGTAAEARVGYVGPAEAETLCGRPLDWVEALP